MLRTTLSTAFLATLALAAASPAGAATVTRAADGAIVIQAAPGASDRVALGPSLSDDPGSISIGDTAGIDPAVPEGCGGGNSVIIDCRLDAAGLRVSLGDGDDTFSSGFAYPVSRPVTVDGGPGRDQITGGGETDTFDGGDGNDTVDGAGGADTVRGGAGNDTVMGDHYEDPSADVIDGGPGDDTFESDWFSRYDQSGPDITLTLGGGADDGRPGEGDDVENVEHVVISQGGSMTGTDGPEALKAFQTLRPVQINGLGGNDDLEGSGGNDTILGGPGDDFIDAGFGDDVITPGPGRDQVFADLRGGDCGPLWCTFPYGNDTVFARDGEVDSINCGFGTDTVYADANDVVAPDCETVNRGPAGPTPTPTPTPTPGPKPGAAGAPTGPQATCRVPGVRGLKLATARRRITAAGCRARAHGRGLHVRSQSIRSGRVVAASTVVNLTLGR